MHIPRELKDRLRFPLVPEQPGRGEPWVFPPAGLPYISLKAPGVGKVNVTSHADARDIDQRKYRKRICGMEGMMFCGGLGTVDTRAY